jgi:hypothetical protein
LNAWTSPRATRRRWSATLACVVLMLLAVPNSVQPQEKHAVQDGEYTLHFGVEWRLIRAGIARVKWSPASNGHQVDMHLESAGVVNKLYHVNDDYRAQLGTNYCGTTVVFNSDEGKRRRETKITFDHGKVSYFERDLTKNTTSSKEVQTPPCVFEYMGAIRKLREMHLDPGQSATVPMTDGKKFANVKVEAQEREEVKTPAGTFKTIRYEVFLFNDVIISKKARMFLWVTEDARRLPVQMRVRLPILIGNITLQLEKEERS